MLHHRIFRPMTVRCATVLLLAALPLACSSERNGSSAAPASSSEDELFAWIRSEGGYVNPRQTLAHLSGVRGMRANAPIQAGT